MITITFECDDSNEVALMLAAWDAIKGNSPEDSFVSVDYTNWLLDWISDHYEDVIKPWAAKEGWRSVTDK